jgi:D-alanyl-lipoteichoic acid acyltransferase DltB (MBOAT superfamily)
MVALLRLFVPFVLFPLVAAAMFRLAPASLKLKLFALINVFGVLGLCVLSSMSGLYFWQLKAQLEVSIPVFALYLLVVLLHYVLMRRYARRAGWVPWIAFLFPIAVMLVLKYVPVVDAPFRAPLEFIGKKHIAGFFVGLSYMAFRLSHMVLEVRNGIVPMPTLWEHLSFGFFVPTMAVGPISRYSVFRQSLYQPDSQQTPLGQSLLRMLKGIAKYLFLASMMEQLAYKGLLFDSHPHRWIDLPVAAVAFYFYLYLNFSGYCDMAIGTAGLLGIQVDENFDRPFSSRNLQEFWTRWHITLSNYMRDTVFTPLTKALIRKMGPRSAQHAIAVSIFAVFVGIGAWHDLTWSFLIFGAIHGIGVASCHYYTIWLRNNLDKARYAAYHRNPIIRSVAVTATFLFVAGSLFFFANSLADIHAIMRILKAG